MARTPLKKPDVFIPSIGLEEFVARAIREQVEVLREELQPLTPGELSQAGDLVAAARHYFDRRVSRADALRFATHVMQGLAAEAAKRRLDVMRAEFDADRAAKAEAS